MRILVCARHFGYLRNFESALVELAARGHTLHLAADREESAGGKAMVDRLAARFPEVSVGWTPKREKDDEWLDVATRIRLSQDFLRYLEHAYDRAPMLRRRSKERTPLLTVRLVERAGFRFRPLRAVLRRVLDALEAGVPLYEPYTRLLGDLAPDVVMLTPLIDLGSPQLDLLKSARALGLRTVLAVGSWDHLSSKALIRIQPDLITVWNEVQRREASEMHGVPSDRIVVTGAQCYDQWFGRRPSRSREAFCRAMGLDPDRPFVLWVCSSLFRGGPPEAEFTVGWIRAIREHTDPRVRGLGILVRPHPGRLDEWRGTDIRALGAAFHGANPIDDQARDDYFDAMHYSAAVVGLNTSAFLEAGIVGRPVLAVLPKAYWKSQEGTLHFRYLLEVGGGLLLTARSIEEHLPQLAEVVSGELVRDTRPFVEAFIRPFGLDQPGSARYADAIERLGRSCSPVPVTPSIGGRACAPLLRAAIAVRKARARRRRTEKDAAHAAEKARIRGKREIERRRRQLRDLATSVRCRLRPRTRRRTLVRPEAFEATEEFQLLAQTLARARTSGRPVVVGPWLSEVGFELLYWIPFLRWAKAQAVIRGDRIIALSRGGTAEWYRDIGSRYLDVFDLCSVDEFRARNLERVAASDGQKHFAVTAFDDDLLERARRRLAVGAVEWLHPGLMYTVFRSFWSHVASTDLVRRFTVPRRLRLAEAGALPFPRPYVAVKFYDNAGLPDDETARRFVAELLERLTRTADVVLLQSGLRVDDHRDLSVGTRGRVHAIDGLLTPATNLQVQTRVVAGATAFVCTYGGFSYLGPLCGVPTLAVYSNPAGFRLDHLTMALRTFRDLAAAPFVTMSLRDIELLEIMLGRPAVAHTP